MTDHADQLVNGLNATHKQVLSDFSAKLQKTIRNSKLRSYVQWKDLSNDDTLHIQIDALEWLGGAKYRKHTYHSFILYNFAPNDTALTDNHKQALNGLLEFVIQPFWAQSAQTSSSRHYELYSSPFFVNLKSSEKDKIFGQQFTHLLKSAASRNASLATNLREHYITGANAQSWWRHPTISFPKTTSEWDASKKALRENANYPCFELKKLMFDKARADISGAFSTIVGSASKSGDEPNNQTLSENRARAVQEYLDSDPFGFGFKTIETSGTGSGNLIVPSPTNLNADENRNARFTYYQASDYIDVAFIDDVSARYKSKLNAVKIANDNRIAQLESIISDAIDGKQQAFVHTSLDPHLMARDDLLKPVRHAECYMKLGQGCFHYCQTDAYSLDDLDSMKGMPNFASHGVDDGKFYIDSPENSGSPFKGSPLEYLLSNGTFSEDKPFRLPLSSDSKLESASKLLSDIVEGFNSYYNIAGFSSLPSYELFTKFYADYICFNKLWAYSFGMRKMTKAKVVSLVKSKVVEYRFNSSSFHKLKKFNYHHFDPSTTYMTITYVSDVFERNFASLLNAQSPNGFYWYDSKDFDLLVENKEVFVTQEYRLLYLYYSTWLSSLRSQYSRFDHISDADKEVLDFFNDTITIVDDELVRVGFPYLR